MALDMPNSDDGDYNIDRHLEEMNDSIKSHIGSSLFIHWQFMEQQRGMLESIRESRCEIQDLLLLLRENRIHSMADSTF